MEAWDEVGYGWLIGAGRKCGGRPPGPPCLPNRCRQLHLSPMSYVIYSWRKDTCTTSHPLLPYTANGLAVHSELSTCARATSSNTGGRGTSVQINSDPEPRGLCDHRHPVLAPERVPAPTIGGVHCGVSGLGGGRGGVAARLGLRCLATAGGVKHTQHVGKTHACAQGRAGASCRRSG